ncbi:geranylgeranyl reductase family protein [uncultured Cyclobacterium sp.]|uniref:geranylgeranyl reductase family protein n=1 Tax=uncultured Cyclobacterium sp. TaxID=453820 RepID=UPI0030ED9987|tara:strand:+ start:67243 stop:68385 length:1143 start_codon:yes stop_codon:yes gene_type:complete
MMKFDIAIIGSGPAGAMAAYKAAEKGKSVVILEKEKLPRYKTCGGGLVHRGRVRLPFSIEEVVEKEYRELVVFFENSSQFFTAKRKEPIISMVMRDSFDQFLVNKALEKGAVLMEQTAALNIERSERALILKTTEGSIQCQYLIGADGVLSNTAKMGGWKESRILIPALEYEVVVSSEDYNRLSGKVRFDVDAVPDGYAWCFPKNGHLSLGVGTLKKQKIDLRKYYNAYLKKLDIKEIISSEAHGFQIPIGKRKDGFSKNRVFLTGDAAGFADPLTAEGISNALLSGELAAQAIADNFHDEIAASEAYQKLLEKQILTDLGSSSIIAFICYAQPAIRNMLLNKFGQKGCEILTDIFMGKKAFPDDLKRKIKSHVPLLKFI